MDEREQENDQDWVTINIGRATRAALRTIAKRNQRSLAGQIRWWISQDEAAYQKSIAEVQP